MTVKTNVIVLNSDYSFLSYTTWKRAIRLIYQGKAEVIKSNLLNKVVRNVTGLYEYVIPIAIRLLKVIREVYRKSVPYSKQNVIARDGMCMYCGSKNLNDLTIDHVVPKSRGGRSTWENCVAACKHCNNKKGDRTPSEAHMWLIKQPKMPTIHEFAQLKLKSFGVNKILKDIFND